MLIDAAQIEPTVTWGINPGQSVGISEKLPTSNEVPWLMLVFLVCNVPLNTVNRLALPLVVIKLSVITSPPLRV